jgi:hypothetical protein
MAKNKIIRMDLSKVDVKKQIANPRKVRLKPKFINGHLKNVEYKEGDKL